MAENILNLLRSRRSSKNDQKTKKKPRIRRTSPHDDFLNLRSETDCSKMDSAFDSANISSWSNSIFDVDSLKLIGCLPKYGFDQQISEPCYLTPGDCHVALMFSIYKARLMLFELRRRVSGLKKGTLVLDGTPRLLDEELVREVKFLREALRVEPRGNVLLQKLLDTHLQLDPRWKLESGQSYMRPMIMGPTSTDVTDR